MERTELFSRAHVHLWLTLPAWLWLAVTAPGQATVQPLPLSNPLRCFCLCPLLHVQPGQQGRRAVESMTGTEQFKSNQFKAC